jgi:hypothetical protein
MDFLNHREGDVVFYQFVLLSPIQCRETHGRNCEMLREFEEIEMSGKAVEGTLIAQRKTLKDFCVDFVQEFGLRTSANAVQAGKDQIFKEQHGEGSRCRRNFAPFNV